MNEILECLAGTITRYLLLGSAAAVVLVPLAWVLTRAARIRTPVYRHAIWLYCLAGVVVLPVLCLYGPKLSLAILPAQVETPAVVAFSYTGSVEPVAPSHELSVKPGPVEPYRPKVIPESAGGRLALSFSRPIAGAWFLGFTFLMARLGIAWCRLRRISMQASPVRETPSPPGRKIRRAAVRLSTRIHGPACFGILRPVILLPWDMYRSSTSEDLRMVLAHEFAHIGRRDGCINLFQRLVEAMFFFHPLVWLASRQLTNEREHICDNYVLAEGASPDDYTTLLFQMVERTHHTRSLSAVALFEGQLLSRVRSLLDPLRNRQTRLPWKTAVAGTVGVAAVLLAFGTVRLVAKSTEAGQDNPDNALQELDAEQGIFELVITGADDAPLEGVRVSIAPMESQQDLTLWSDPNGMVRCRLAPGEYHLGTVYKRDYIGRYTDEAVTIAKNQTSRVEIQLRKCPRITGTIRDNDGKTISGVIVGVLPAGDGYVCTDAEGSFGFGLDPQYMADMGRGFAYVYARHRERNLVRVVPVDANDKAVDVRLATGMKIIGRVVDPNGKPIPAASVVVKFWPRRFGFELEHWPVATDDEGCYEIGAVASGFKYTVGATADGYGRESTRPFFELNETADGRHELPPFVLKGADCSVSGTVVDEEDRPVPNASVWLEGDGQPSRRTISDDQGRFVLENICTGEITISAYRRSRDGELRGEVQTEADSKDVELVVTPRDSRGRPIPRQPASLLPPLPARFEGIDTDLDLEQTKGKRLLVCFWDMSQRPSRRLVQELVKRTEALKENDVTVLLIHAGDTDQSTMDRWLRERGIRLATGIVTAETPKVLQDWTVQGLPWLVLLDEQHVIRAAGFDLAQLDESLKSKNLERLPLALDWRAKFDMVYRLDEGQILKRIAPPFIPERQKYYTTEHETQASLIPRGPDVFVFHWDGGLRNWGLSFGEADLALTLSLVSRLKSYEYEGPEELLKLELPGDWIIRDDAAIESKLKALEQLLAAEVRRNIRFEKRSVEQEVMVATGRFKFHPLPDEERRLHMYVDDADLKTRGGGGGTADSVRELLEALGNRVGMRVIDQTQPSEATQIFYNHHSASYLTRVKDPAEKAARLKQLLENFSRQTSLQFKVERRAVEKWFVVEGQPGTN